MPTEKSSSALTVTICGGGNGAHAAAAYIASKPAIKVNVLTRRPSEWSKCIKIDTSISSWARRGDIVGWLNKVSDKPSELIYESDIVILAAPANAHLEILAKIKPYVRNDVLLGTLFAQGGFDWAAHSAFQGDLSQLGALFGLQNIPWLCRIRQYGREVQLIGPKLSLLVAAFPSNKTKHIAQVVSYLFDIPAYPLPNFMTLTLTPSNQIIHPARYYSIFHGWDGKRAMKKEEIQWGLYSEMDDNAAYWMQKLDDELQSIKKGLVRRFPHLDLSHVLPLAERIVQQYGDDVTDRTNLKTIIASNKGYAGCVTPAQHIEGGYIPALNSRLFWEDVPFGLCILKSIAEMLGLATPTIDFMIEWHQQFMNKKYLINGKLNPELIPETACPAAYGINSLEELVGFSLSSPMGSASSPNSPRPSSSFPQDAFYPSAVACADQNPTGKISNVENNNLLENHDKRNKDGSVHTEQNNNNNSNSNVNKKNEKERNHINHIPRTNVNNMYNQKYTHLPVNANASDNYVQHPSKL